MAFDLSTVTNTGATMLANATSGNKLIIDGCGISDTVYTLEQAKSISVFSGTMQTNAADIVGFTTNHVVFRAAFPASSSYGGTRHSLILFGHMHSDTTITKKAIAVCSDEDGFVLPSPDDVVNHFECLFTIQYALDPNVVTVQTSALETSKAEFDAFKADVVTREGAQTIPGNKTFTGNLEFNSEVNFLDDFSFSGSFTNGNIIIDGSLIEVPWITSEQIKATNYIKSEGNITAAGNISTTSGNITTTSGTIKGKNLEATYNVKSLTFEATEGVFTNSIGAITDGPLTIDSPVTEKVLVKKPLQVAETSSHSVTISEGNVTTETANVGTATINKLKGPVPKLVGTDTTLTAEVGSIVSILITNLTSHSGYYCGALFTVEANTYKAGMLTLNPLTLTFEGNYVPAGSYRALLCIRPDTSETSNLLVLAVRVL